MDIEVIGEDKLKARKPYVCDMCGKEISVGESYIKTFCKDHDSGKIITNRLHERCEDLVGLYNRIHGAIPDDMSFREVGEWVQEEYCPTCLESGGLTCNGDIFTCKGF